MRPIHHPVPAPILMAVVFARRQYGNVIPKKARWTELRASVRSIARVGMGLRVKKHEPNRQACARGNFLILIVMVQVYSRHPPPGYSVPCEASLALYLKPDGSAVPKCQQVRQYEVAGCRKKLWPFKVATFLFISRENRMTARLQPLGNGFFSGLPKSQCLAEITHGTPPDQTAQIPLGMLRVPARCR